MKATKKMVKEALAEMELLNLRPDAIEAFRKEGKVSLSGQNGVLSPLNAEQEKLVQEWEEETGNLVFHAIRYFTEGGELLNLLFVSRDAVEWAMNRLDFTCQQATCYAIDLEHSRYSDYDLIGIALVNGGVVCTGSKYLDAEYAVGF